MDTAQEEIIADFELFDGNMDDKYNYLIELGSSIAEVDTAPRVERYAISGCQSKVWLAAEMTDDGRVHFMVDSDAHIPKGIIALLLKVLNGRTPRRILDTELYFIERTGLGSILSPTRTNGLAAMIRQMRMYALAFEARGQKNENR
jgi:cysteine desulfuration protein SufE